MEIAKLNINLPSPIWLLFLFPGLSVQAQDSLELRARAFIPGQFIFLTTDQLQQFYAVTESQELIKFDPTGKELFRYNNFTLGSLAHVDATNPFNLLLFYPDFQAVALLDRTLSQVGELNLLDLDLPDARAIALDNDNFIWVYDPVQFRLRKLNTQGRVIQESENLALSLSFPLKPDFLLARDNQLFLNDPEHGVLVFDNFGRLEKVLSFQGLKSYQVRERRLVFFEDQKIRTLLLINQALEEKPLPSSLKGGKSFRLEQDLLYVLFEDGVRIFRVDGT